MNNTADGRIVSGAANVDGSAGVLAPVGFVLPMSVGRS